MAGTGRIGWCGNNGSNKPRSRRSCPLMVAPLVWLDCWWQQSDARPPTGGLLDRVVGIAWSAIHPSNEERRDCWLLTCWSNDQSRSGPAYALRVGNSAVVESARATGWQLRAAASLGHLDLLSSQFSALRAVCVTIGVTAGVTVGVAADSDIMIVQLVGRARRYSPASPPTSTAPPPTCSSVSPSSP